SKAAICKVERGDDNITSDRVTKFAKALNCSESYLMGWQEENKELSEDETFINMYKSLDEESKRQLVLMAAFFKSQQDNK
ncbi:MAG: helix-turn-helix transcriptional regulator, partial [Prevotellaceae bacterium]|nr:helix-turn-helix transcriptional regulator [Candidatus Faecinaster equi]